MHLADWSLVRESLLEPKNFATSHVPDRLMCNGIGMVVDPGMETMLTS